MSLTLHNLQAPKGTANKKKRRVGRGNSSGSGTYSNRGLKGQRSRSGGKSGLKVRALRARLQSVPKLKGFKSIHKKAKTVNVGDLERNFDADAIISPKALIRKGLIDTPRFGVKLLGQGKVSKAFTIRKCEVSASAREKIEKAGGKIEEKAAKEPVKKK